MIKPTKWKYINFSTQIENILKSDDNLFLMKKFIDYPDQIPEFFHNQLETQKCIQISY